MTEIEELRELVKDLHRRMNAVERQLTPDPEIVAKCPECQSTGMRTDRTYCGCPMGRDIKRIERRRRIVGDEAIENTWEGTQP